jgi:hypothetical protein
VPPHRLNDDLILLHGGFLWRLGFALVRTMFKSSSSDALSTSFGTGGVSDSFPSSPTSTRTSFGSSAATPELHQHGGLPVIRSMVKSTSLNALDEYCPQVRQMYTQCQLSNTSLDRDSFACHTAKRYNDVCVYAKK